MQIFHKAGGYFLALCRYVEANAVRSQKTGQNYLLARSVRQNSSDPFSAHAERRMVSGYSPSHLLVFSIFRPFWRGD